MGRDHTIFATSNGKVRFHRTTGGRTIVSVEPQS
jgi:ribosomal protein L27